MTTEKAAHNGTASEGFGTRALTTTAETHTGALVAAAQAAVNARFVMALQRPRDWMNVRTRLLAECARPGFAEVARYLKPIGKGVEGASIRFAEACLRYAGNMDAPVTTTFEDRYKRILHVAVIDYESNSGYSVDITIEKTVERKSSSDRVVVATRTNSQGKDVFIVESTEDELLNKQNALVSKAVRTLILRLIPGDIVDEGQAACLATLDGRAKQDPTAEKKRICDAFASVGVYPNDLAVLLGHSLDAVQPAELTMLRGVYATLRDGETTWAAVLENKRGPAKEETTTAGGAPATRSLDDDLAATPPKPATPPPAAAAPAQAPAAAAPAAAAPQPAQAAPAPTAAPTAPAPAATRQRAPRGGAAKPAPTEAPAAAAPPATPPMSDAAASLPVTEHPKTTPAPAPAVDPPAPPAAVDPPVDPNECPVCGKTVDLSQAGTSVVQGRAIHDSCGRE